MAKRGMGRGLAAILPAEPVEGSTEPALRNVAVELIRPNPAQPRRRFDPESIEALAESIAAAGIIQPLVVRPLDDGRYELIAGERRWRAAQRAGLEEVPALLRVEEEVDRLQTALIENVAREDLNPIDEARACSMLVDDLGITKEELGRRLGRSRSGISNLIRLLDLPEEALDLLASGELTEGHGRAILAAPDHERRRALARAAAREDWSVRETERRAREELTPARPPRRPDPERDAVLSEAEDRLEAALGRGVRVRSTSSGAIRAELSFSDLDELSAFLAERAR
ncbi:ParB/RepB/Spo0J family partition protein [Thermoleophilia bacterium SCSIO 60948]|nr:ParB/RepB/Spo0J family partition protein [Thermoleophilia bacterium SCSIO 60948]